MKKDIDLGGIEGIKSLIRASRIYRYYLSDMILRGATEEHKKSHLEDLAKALLPYLQDKVDWDEEKVAFECYASTHHDRGQATEDWNMESPEIYKEFRGYAKALTAHFSPPQRIWPEEKEYSDKISATELCENKGFNECLSACKAAHPVKEIEWPKERLLNSKSDEINKRNVYHNDCLAECKLAERKRYE